MPFAFDTNPICDCVHAHARTQDAANRCNTV